MFVPPNTKCRYTILEQELRAQILSGKLKAGEMIPGEFELASIYKLGRTTVRKALRRLADQNFLCKVNGSGTYVMPESERLAHARKLTRIRLIVPAGQKEISEFDREILSGVDQYARTIRCRVEVVPDDVTAEKLLRDYRNFEIDGLIWCRLAAESFGKVEQLRDAHLPQTLIARSIPEVSEVSFDTAVTFSDAVGLLKAIGHKKILLIDKISSSAPWSVRRQDFFNACSAQECEPELLALRSSLGSYESDLAEAEKKITEQLKKENIPDAVIISHNFSAVLKSAAAKRKLVIPGDLSVLELCDIPSQCGLTEIRQPLAAMGREALRLLFAGKGNAEKILIPGEIVFGKSIGLKNRIPAPK